MVTVRSKKRAAYEDGVLPRESGGQHSKVNFEIIFPILHLLFVVAMTLNGEQQW